MILSALADYLRSDVELTDDIAGRLTFHRRPQGVTYPAVVLNQTTAADLDELDGKPSCDATTIEAVVWASDRSGGLVVLERVGDRLRALLEGLSGLVGGFVVRGCNLLSDIPTPVRPTDGSDDWLHRRVLTFRILATNQIIRA